MTRECRHFLREILLCNVIVLLQLLICHYVIEISLGSPLARGVSQLIVSWKFEVIPGRRLFIYSRGNTVMATYLLQGLVGSGFRVTKWLALCVCSFHSSAFFKLVVTVEDNVRWMLYEPVTSVLSKPSCCVV